MNNKKNKKKSYFIYLSNVYRLTTVTLLVCIIVLGLLYVNANGQKKCEKASIIKKEIINPNVVFFGDSITDYYDLDKYYPNLKKVNSGISGQRTGDLKKDMYNRVYRYNPSKVILLIGINNFLSDDDSVDNVVGDIKEIVENIHKELPNTEISIQSIYPINTDWGVIYNRGDSYVHNVTKKIIDSNDKIKKYCNDNKYTYIDVFEELSDDNCEFKREYTNDGLHPNEKGYDKITETLKKYL